jgi:hypothetical protein
VDNAERFGVDFELAEDTDKLVGTGLEAGWLVANLDWILSLSPAWAFAGCCPRGTNYLLAIAR